MEPYPTENHSSSRERLSAGVNLTNFVPDYVQAMGLSFDPFADVEKSPSPRGFFIGGGRQEICDQLVHLTEFSASVVVVSGSRGAGKTTFFNALPQYFDAGWTLCGIEADVLSDAGSVFESIAESLSAPVKAGSNTGELLAGIRHQLTRGLDASLLVMIDDAHLLDDAILSALLSLMQAPAHDEELPLHVLLLGDESLIERLDAFSMVDVMLHDLSLKPFTRDECGDYLMSCLRSSGWEQALPFDGAELDRLFSLSGGIPGLLHESARQLLLDRVTVDLEAVDRGPGLPVAHMFSLVLLVGVLLMAFFYKDSWLSSPDGELVAKEGVQPEEKVAGVLGAETSQQQADMDRMELDSKGAGEISLDQVMPEPAQDLVQVESEIEASSLRDEPVVPANLPREKPVFLAPEPVEPEAIDFTALPAPAAYQTDIKLEEPQLSAAVPGVAEVSLESDLSVDEQALMALEADHYVLQVMAAGSKSAVERFINAQKNRSALRLFTTERQGKPWYVVVTGDYDSSQAARRGVADLPSAQKKAGPWPRAALDVQAKIKDFRSI